MLKDVSYHESAVRYNEELQVYAEKVAETLEHPEIKKWCLSVARQHKFHAGRHKKALQKLQEQGEEGATINTEDGGEDRVIDDEHIVHRSAESGQFVTEDEADEHPSTTVAETIEDDVEKLQTVPETEGGSDG